VPITIKESFAYRGSANAWGLPQLKDAISPRTAVAVERLEAAGAIVVGKNERAGDARDWQTEQPDPRRVEQSVGRDAHAGRLDGRRRRRPSPPGLGCLTIGSDLAGSIRIPAHFCGVYGHKPSLNLVSMAGFQPGPWDGSPGYPMDLAVVGPSGAKRA
jgi:amidase